MTDSIKELKDPDDVVPFHIVWCDADGTNDGTTSDNGWLQGATISTSTWTVPAGLTEDSSNTSSVTLGGVTYSANTVSTVWLSGGTAGEDYHVECQIVTSDGRTKDWTLIIYCRQT